MWILVLNGPNYHDFKEMPHGTIPLHGIHHAAGDD